MNFCRCAFFYQPFKERRNCQRLYEAVNMNRSIDVSIHDQVFNVSQSKLKLQVPVKMIVNGSSGSGKTRIVLDFLRKQQEIFSETFNSVFYCIPVNSSLMVMDTINEAKEICPFNLSIIEGLPSIEKLHLHSPTLLILDDLYDACVQSSQISNIMTFSSRRLNISVIIVCQNIFLNGTYNLTIRSSVLPFIFMRYFLAQTWIFLCPQTLSYEV